MTIFKTINEVYKLTVNFLLDLYKAVHDDIEEFTYLVFPEEKKAIKVSENDIKIKAKP